MLFYAISDGFLDSVRGGYVAIRVVSELMVFSLPAVDRIFRLRLKICSRVAFTRLYFVEWYSAVNLRYFSWMIT